MSSDPTIGNADVQARLNLMMGVAETLGDALADIAELVGLDRSCEDLAITPRVRQLVQDPRVREVLEEFRAAENGQDTRCTA